MVLAIVQISEMSLDEICLDYILWLYLMASWTCDVVRCIDKCCMQFANIPVFYICCTVCCMFIVMVNCLNVSDIYLIIMSVLLVKVVVLCLAGLVMPCPFYYLCVFLCSPTVCLVIPFRYLFCFAV